MIDRERYVGVLASALVVCLVALDLDAVYIASGACLLVAFVILVGIATAGGLVVQPNNDDDTYEQGLPPSFLKNAATHNTFNYKPYSLFGEPLSHISEEDSLMVGRSQYTPSLLRRDSHQSTCSANSVTTTMSYYHEYGATHTSYPHRYPTNAQPSLSSAKDLAMLPMPPPHAPLATLGLPRQVGPTTLPWQLHSMSVSALLLGLIYGLINALLPVFLVEGLALDPIYCGLALMLPLVADVVLHVTVHWVMRLSCVDLCSLFLFVVIVGTETDGHGHGRGRARDIGCLCLFVCMSARRALASLDLCLSIRPR